MKIDYDHSLNSHTLDGPRAVMPVLFKEWKPASLLDVGCGVGTWLKVAGEFGIEDVFGIDGVAIPAENLLVSPSRFRQQDLTTAWDLGRRFDVVLCLEVAEHLEPEFGPRLIEQLTRHGDVVVFSAACPGQLGQHHVNCQWPDYWQKLFNSFGFVCDDSARWQLWNNDHVEPWYRQNIFIARRQTEPAAPEPRILGVMHPGVSAWITNAVSYLEENGQRMEAGKMGVGWHLKTLGKAIQKKFQSH